MASATVTAVPNESIDATRTRPTWFTPGWVCATVLTITSGALVHWYGVSAQDVVTFTLYSVLGIAVPGALVWRGLLGRPSHIATDLAAGTAIGFSIEIPVYVLCRTLDVPIAVLIWPLVTLLAFTAVPRLRRHWRGSGERQTVGVTLTYVVLWSYVLVSSAMSVFRTEGLSGPAAERPYVDIPFHLALTGELKHHFPARIPYVAGQSLDYHWYVYAHIAAASWLTGIEPQVLILRLIALPMLAAFGVLVVAVGRDLTGRDWPGLLAIALTCIATVTSPYTWDSSTPAVSPLDVAWLSPTQTFAMVIFGGLVLALVGILHGTYGRRRGPWIVLFLTAGAAAGSKATFLPLLAAGAGCVLAAQLIRVRRVGPIGWVFAIIGGWLVFAQFVLFGDGTEGMVVAPLNTAKRTLYGVAVFGRDRPANHYPALLVICALILAAWAFAWAGGIGMLTREVRSDAATWLIAGIGAAGVCAVFAFDHPALSQYYFLMSSRPYVSLAAAVGLAALARPAGRRRTVLWVVGGALGIAAVYTVQATAGRTEASGGHLLIAFAVPFVVLVAVLVALAGSLVVVGRHWRLDRRAIAGAVAVMAIATVAPAAVGRLDVYRQAVTTTHRRNVVSAAASLPPGAIRAMRWLRDHSDPDDLVATNEHCRMTSTTVCDARDFWVSGYSERRVLVEGWAYTRTALAHATQYSGAAGGPYWDPALLASNDVVFVSPTVADVEALASRYGVRWLVAAGSSTSPLLGSVATLRFETAGVHVYEIPRQNFADRSPVLRVNVVNEGRGDR